MIKLVKTALSAFLKGLPEWFRTRYLWAMLLIPVVCYVIVYMLADADVMGWRTASTAKSLMEVVHPSMLASGVVLGLLGYAVTRAPSLGFMSVLCAFTLAREIGGQGSSIILYIGLIMLITYGYANLSSVYSLLQSRLVSSCVASTFVCYFVSQLLDRGVIKRVGWLFTEGSSWAPPYSSQIEESLESLGGAFLLMAVLIETTGALVNRGSDE